MIRKFNTRLLLHVPRRYPSHVCVALKLHSNIALGALIILCLIEIVDSNLSQDCLEIFYKIKCLRTNNLTKVDYE